MRIVYLTDRLSLRGGADLHLRHVVCAAAAAGHSIVLAHGGRHRGATPPAGADAVTVRALGAAARSTSGLGPLDHLLADADVVHVQNVMNADALAAATATGRAVVTVQDHRVFCPGPGRTLPDGQRCRATPDDDVCAGCLPDEAYRRRLLDLTAARLDAVCAARAVVVLSRYMAGELEAAGVTDPIVIPPAVEVGPARTDAGSGVVVAGRLVAHKGVRVAYEGWCAARSSTPLVVAGDGAEAALLTMAEHRGWLPNPRLRALLRTARLLLFTPRWQEPFGIVAVEALAEGTPVVTTGGGGTGEWSDAGCVVVDRDPRAVAGAIDDLVADPAAALARGERGRRMVERRFAPPAIEHELLEVYERVAGDRFGARSVTGA